MENRKLKKERISLSIEKSLLEKFEDHCKAKGYQKRNDALIDLIEKELQN